ncbi:hypothetical protein RB195_020509 [Necator americanus]|uniref:Proteolipid membrane potential modulator n=1 Tax=Necator americanus TaxID=51031 RepID=A0ABR1CL97_NECAM
MCRRCCEFLCAILFPPIAVMCHSGCSSDLCINVLLTACGIIPGMIHAMCLVCSEDIRTVHVTHVNVTAPPYQLVASTNHVVPPPPSYDY